MSETEIITTGPALERLAARLLGAEAAALDTEFLWERTHYPLLGLLQISTGLDESWLVDTVQLPDLRALAPVLESPSVVKILHDAPQDLWILRRATGALPRSIFDTRLAAGFAGLSSTCSLQSLLHDALGVDLAKTETQSDWLRRPLTPAQLSYAVDDVRHLPELRAALWRRCAGERERAWLRSELAQLDDPVAYDDRDPRAMYRRVKGGARLDARGLALLRELAAWRELEARRRNWPRGFVLSDGALVALAQRNPAGPDDLAGVSEMPRRLPGSVAAAIVAAVAKGRALPEADCPVLGPPLSREARKELKVRSDRLLAHLRAACAAHGIDPALAASRGEVEAYLRPRLPDAADAHPLKSGWRA